MKLSAALFIAITCLALLFSIDTMAGDQKIKRLELFGVALKNADRDQIRQAVKQHGMQVKREDSRYWVDTYDASAVLEGASEFDAGYVAKTDKFAYGSYIFSSFMNTGTVTKVIKMVSIKYGAPSSKDGRDDLGEVTATWNMGEGMLIKVTRGWPDTTTTLSFIDTAANKAMRAEIDAQKETNERQTAKAQNGAF